MKQPFTIQSTLTLTNFLHVAQPGSAYYNPDTGRESRSLPPGGGFFPFTRTTRMKVAKPSTAQNEGDEEGQQEITPRLPVFPANDIGGRLQRLAAREIFDLLVSKNDPVPLEVYHCMTCGAATGQPYGDLTVQAARSAMTHPFLGVFGGGPRLVRSASIQGTLWPITELTLDLGLVPDTYADKAILASNNRSLTEIIFFRRSDDVLTFADPAAGTIIKNYDQSVEALQGRIAENSAARRKKREATATTEEQATKKVGLQSFTGIEVVVPGVTLFSSVMVDTQGPGQAGLGLMLAAMIQLAKQQKIGGWIRNGFGQFVMESTLIHPDGTREPFLTPVHPGQDPVVPSPGVTTALQAWEEAAQKITAKDLYQIYQLDDMGEEKK